MLQFLKISLLFLHIMFLFLVPKQTGILQFNMNQVKVLPISPCKPRKPSLLEHYFQALEKGSEANFILLKFFEHFDSVGPHYFLIEKMFALKNFDFYFFAHQLVYLTLKKQSHPLNTLLRQKASQSFGKFLLLLWSVNAFGAPIKKKGGEAALKIKHIEQRILSSILFSHEISEDKPIAGCHYIQSLSTQSVQETRMSYYMFLKQFITQLVNLSAKLKTMNDKQRKPHLYQQIKKANIELERFRTNSQRRHIAYCQGIHLPFFPSKDKEENSDLLVNIVQNQGSCFNTKTRVPYRIVIETISSQQLFSQRKRTAQNSTEIQATDFFSDLSADLKQFMSDFDAKKNDLNLMYMMMKQQIQVETGKNSSQVQKQLPIINLKIKDVEETFIKKKINKSKFHELIEAIPTKLSPDQKKRYNTNIRSFMLFYKIPNPAFIKRRLSSSNVFSYHVSKPRVLSKRLGSKIFKQAQIKLKRAKSVSQISNKQLVSFLSKLESLYPSLSWKISSIKNYFIVNLEEDPEDEEEFINQKVKRLWAFKQQQFRKKSPYGHFRSYRARNIMVKGGDDLRQEILVMQLMNKFKLIFQQAELQLILKPYEITLIDESSGLLEFVRNSNSIDGLKKQEGFVNIRTFLLKQHCGKYHQAQKKFICSLAAYSIFTYLLQVKDRHNGNILMDDQGHIIHIDFGFILGTSPGGIGFQSSPFKLTQEYLQVMQGKESALYLYFKNLILKGMLQLKSHCAQIFMIVEIMMQESDLPCFNGFSLQQFKDRFRVNANYFEMENYVESLVESSCCNMRTNLYDHFQWKTNGIKI